MVRILCEMNVRRAASVAVAGVLVALAGCAASGPAATAARSPRMRAYAAEYLAIARPANRQLDRSEDAYTENAHHDLGAARAALRAQAATERQFDRRLAAISFPPRIAAIARSMIAANTVRISLALEQARAASVAALVAFTARHKAADAAVEVQARLIRRELGLPPPSTS
jgi:hypothetical protein